MTTSTTWSATCARSWGTTGRRPRSRGDCRRVGARAALLALTLLADRAAAQRLELPPRPAEAPVGSALVAALRDLDHRSREERLHAEIAGGNIPSWLRTLVPVTFTRRLDGRDVRVTFWATPDYLAVGSDDDYFLVPLSPHLAQRIADLTRTSLPTPPMVDAIWRQAAARLGPDSIAPSAAMITVPVFADHDRLVRVRRLRESAPPGALVAGHKKDVVLSRRLDSLPGRVAIYGWHHPDGRPIQPLNTWHTSGHVDYSHGIRLIDRRVIVDGLEHDLVALLRDPARTAALSDEGPMREARYPTTWP